jgi:hypothetical protein
MNTAPSGIFFFVLCSLILPLTAWSQKVGFRFYTTADGLISNRVQRCFQDDQDFIWIVKLLYTFMKVIDCQFVIVQNFSNQV